MRDFVKLNRRYRNRRVFILLLLNVNYRDGMLYKRKHVRILIFFCAKYVMKYWPFSVCEFMYGKLDLIGVIVLSHEHGHIGQVGTNDPPPSLKGRG